MHTANNIKTKGTSPVTYIPPLYDGACGTIPRSQQPLWAMMRREMAQMAQTMPSLCWAMLFQRRSESWADWADMMLHTLLAGVEIWMVAGALPLYLIFPSSVFTIYACLCAAVVVVMSRMLNGREEMHQCQAGCESWMMGQDMEDEKWLFMGGMGMR